VEPHRRRAPRHGHRAAARVAQRRDQSHGAQRARRRDPRGARLRLLPAQQAAEWADYRSQVTPSSSTATSPALTGTGVSSRGPGSIPVAIARLGFADLLLRAGVHPVAGPALAGLIDSREHIEDHGLAAALAGVADPDLAPCSALVRFMEAASAATRASRPGHRGAGGTGPRASAAARGARAARRPSATTCAPTRSSGAPSRGRSPHRAAAHRAARRGGERPRGPTPAVDACGWHTANNCSGSRPWISRPATHPVHLPGDGRGAGRPGRGGAGGRSRHRPRRGRGGRRTHPPGGHRHGQDRRGELNYISDVDVIFVAEPADGVPEERGRRRSGRTLRPA
jgi:glutamate-ammonia-ligase adenylyltransferase